MWGSVIKIVEYNLLMQGLFYLAYVPAAKHVITCIYKESYIIIIFSNIITIKYIAKSILKFKWKMFRFFYCCCYHSDQLFGSVHIALRNVHKSFKSRYAL